ncbi:MAG: MFS transporter [Rhodoferax sp.]|nr:MFS transporter [Rhodoferax sp.]
MTLLARRAVVQVFLAFALAYFLSALIRAITATLSPVLMQEFSLQARDLGLLGGAYFLGFSMTQLPLGTWLDRHGPRRVLLGFLTVAVVGCLAFAAAPNLPGLFAARMLCGVGVSACLMAPLTGYRRWLSPAAQMRSNAWMLMTGSMGMVASTLPVQWLMPILGWRPLFVLLAGLIALAMVGIAATVPAWNAPASGATPAPAPAQEGYAQVWRHPYFRALVPLGFFCYGGLVAVQTLWAAPWMVTLAGHDALQAATGMFWINVAMLCAFWSWGVATPWLVRHGWPADRLMTWGLPLSFLVLGATIVCTPWLPGAAAGMLAAFCVTCSCVTLSQPAVGMAFPPALAGRALSAFNLVIFLGVFVVQWSIGLLIDGLGALGLARSAAFQVAMAMFLVCCIAAYGWFLRAAGHNRPA